MSNPRDWSPKGSVKGVLNKLIEEFKNSNQSEAIAIADVLESVHEDEDSIGLALAILDEFTDAAEYARKELKKTFAR